MSETYNKSREELQTSDARLERNAGRVIVFMSLASRERVFGGAPEPATDCELCRPRNDTTGCGCHLRRPR